MATQYAEDQEVFEIVDFTTASEWERFIAAVEEAIHEWRLAGDRIMSPLTKGQLATATWREKSVTVKFADFPFKMTHHCMITETVESPPEESEPRADYESEEETEVLPQALDDLMNRENDFPARAHCLVRWYGLREFVTISPENSAQPIVSPSKAMLLLSSLTVAANNTSCQVPLFVQVRSLREKMYLGVGMGAGVRTDYNMVYTKHPPRQYTHLAGLLDVFRSKLQCDVSSPPVLVSVRFTYVLSEWPHTLWTQQPPDFDATLTEVGFSELGTLPFGALSDPVSELHLSATWPCVSEDVLVDSDVYSDLDPGSAPIWKARLVTASSPPCLLSEYLVEFLDVCRNTQTVTQILGPEFNQEDDENMQFTSALDRLTESRVPTISKMVGQVHPGNKHSNQISNSPPGEKGPIPVDILVPVLNYLFPDAEKEDQSAPYSSTLSQVPEWSTENGQTEDHPLKTVLMNMKSSGVDGLVWRLAIVFCHVIHSLGGLPAAAHFWHEIVLELRFRWDNAILVPGIGSGSPDLASTILHQKLQMLNCCIARRQAREKSMSKSENDDAEEEDEFYECEEEMEEDERSQSSRSVWDKPEGRLKRCGQLRLISTNEPLYVPYTQEPAPMTEDRLEEHADVLLRLGTDTVGSQLRARMMSASLLSDMESFKAANPGAILEDFVRWYSPRDWIEQPSDDPSLPPKGSLSTRMQIPGNMWQEVWGSAKPVPARRQKRLFDDTREAEQVLHWLASMGPGAVCCHLQPTILHASLCRLAEERLLFSLPAPNSLPQPRHNNTLAAILDMIAQRVTRLSRQPPDTAKYQEVVDQIAEVEGCIARAQSVRHKILGESPSSGLQASSLEDLVLRLLDSPEVNLEGGPRGPAGAVIRKLFQHARRASLLVDDSPLDLPDSLDERRSSIHPNSGPASDLGRPVGREYLLRTLVPSPTIFSRPVPHRMFAVICPNEFRLAGAFSQDTTFC